MAVLNRCAIVVLPREPMRAWSRAVQDLAAAEASADAESLYLVPTFDDEEGERHCLESCWPAIFEAELERCCRDRCRWPAPRSQTLFHDWFQLRLLPLVEDLGDQPLQSYDPEGRLQAVLGLPFP